jgi:hypothetical protein
MTREQYEKSRDDLFDRWLKARPEYEEDNKEFTRDGISNFERWEKQEPKILFLLKEAWGGFIPLHPEQKIKGMFGINIARWKLVIKELYNNRDAEPVFMEAWQRPEYNDDIAIVEVKKVDEEKTSSNINIINEFAVRDSAFLKEQIDLINPDIVFCCGTTDAYGNHIFGDDTWEQISSIFEPRPCHCYKHKNRLIIDFYHPTLIGTDPKMMVNLLGRLIKEGNVFDKFDWKN